MVECSCSMRASRLPPGSVVPNAEYARHCFFGADATGEFGCRLFVVRTLSLGAAHDALLAAPGLGQGIDGPRFDAVQRTRRQRQFGDLNPAIEGQFRGGLCHLPEAGRQACAGPGQGCRKVPLKLRRGQSRAGDHAGMQVDVPFDPEHHVPHRGECGILKRRGEVEGERTMHPLGTGIFRPVGHGQGEGLGQGRGRIDTRKATAAVDIGRPDAAAQQPHVRSSAG
jgi:hypothetical protein